MPRDPSQQGREAASIEEVLHEVFARGLQVAQYRQALARGCEIIEREFHLGAAGHSDQVDQRVGGAGQRHVDQYRIQECRTGQDVTRAQIFPHHLHDASSGAGCHLGVGRIDGGDGAGARKGHAQHFGQARHGGGSAHRVAHPGGAGGALADAPPCRLVQLPGAIVSVRLPGTGPGAQRGVPAVVPVQHGSRRHEHRRHVHGRRPHQQPRRGLVAPAQQHRAVDRVGAEDLLRLQRQQVAVDQRAGPDERLADTERWHHHGEAAGLPHAALHLLHPLREMGVARVEVGPGGQDADDRLVPEILRDEAHLLGAVGFVVAGLAWRPEPALAPQIRHFEPASHHG